MQPTADRPFTDVGADSTWNNSTHPGSAYAALLVNPEFVAPPTFSSLPKVGVAVAAVATAEGALLSRPAPRKTCCALAVQRQAPRARGRKRLTGRLAAWGLHPLRQKRLPGLVYRARMDPAGK